MRTFRDTSGKGWTVVLGRESWGTMVAIFAPDEGGRPLRVVLPPTGYVGGRPHLEGLSEGELVELLEHAEPMRSEAQGHENI